MNHNYQNIGFTPDGQTSKFADKSQPGTEVTFKSRRVNATVKGGGSVPMVNASVALRANTDVTICGEVCPKAIVQSVSLGFNVLHGDDGDLVNLRTELNRLVDVALEQYMLAEGFVPPVYAAFQAP